MMVRARGQGSMTRGIPVASVTVTTVRCLVLFVIRPGNHVWVISIRSHIREHFASKCNSAYLSDFVTMLEVDEAWEVEKSRGLEVENDRLVVFEKRVCDIRDMSVGNSYQRSGESLRRKTRV